MDEMIRLRDLFRENADILDELIALKAKEDEGADIKKECESILGRLALKMMELQSLQANM